MNKDNRIINAIDNGNSRALTNWGNGIFSRLGSAESGMLDAKMSEYLRV